MAVGSNRKINCFNSDSNQTFIALNLPFTKATGNITKKGNQCQYPWKERIKHHREHQGETETKVGMPYVNEKLKNKS